VQLALLTGHNTLNNRPSEPRTFYCWWAAEYKIHNRNHDTAVQGWEQPTVWQLTLRGFSAVLLKLLLVPVTATADACFMSCWFSARNTKSHYYGNLRFRNLDSTLKISEWSPHFHTSSLRCILISPFHLRPPLPRGLFLCPLDLCLAIPHLYIVHYSYHSFYSPIYHPNILTFYTVLLKHNTQLTLQSPVVTIRTLCSTKIKRPRISYVPLRQSRDVQLPS
jgi:hypothetical protein